LNEVAGALFSTGTVRLSNGAERVNGPTAGMRGGGTEARLATMITRTNALVPTLEAW
jgi:hypothetical protein